MTGKLDLDPALVARARALAARAGAPVVDLARGHTTVAVERATLRLAGIEGADPDGIPWVNRLVDAVTADVGLGHGVTVPVWHAMAREGMLPAALAKVHEKHGTPHMALLTILGAASLGLLAPMNLTSLFLAVNIPTLLKYAATCIAATVVVRKHPDIYEGAPIQVVGSDSGSRFVQLGIDIL